MLTAQIVIKNNESTLESCIKSLLPLDCQIIVGNIGSTDSSKDICRKCGVKVKDIPWDKDYSKARNSLLTEEWNLIIEPWESLVQGHKNITKPKKPQVFDIQILENNIISNEIRYWHGTTNKFSYPVYETVIAKSTPLDDCIILSKNKPDFRKDKLELSKNWLTKEPTKAEPYYYVAMSNLAIGDYKSFVNNAEQYLLKDSSSQSSIMIRYYLAHTFLHCYQDTQMAGKYLLGCLAGNPLMAEFWCLLGDLYYKQNKFQKAIAFYENAMLLGFRRSSNDGWPIEIEKYRNYPTKMIESCKEIKKNTKTIARRK